METNLDRDAPRLRARRTAPRHAAATARTDRRAIGAILAVVLAAALVAVVLWRSDPRPEPGSGAAVAEQPTWEQHVTELYDVRAEAFSSADTDLLAKVYTENSRQLRADLETIESLAAQDRAVVGFAPTVLEILSVAESSGAVVVVVRDKIAPFDIVDSTGTRMPVAGRAAAQSTLTLHRRDGIWLIASAERAAG